MPPPAQDLVDAAQGTPGRTRLRTLCGWLSLLLGNGLAFVAHSSAPVAGTGTHAFDAARSQAEFNVRTLWLSSVHGEFNRVSGFLRVDDTGKVSVFAWIDMDELRMSNPRYAETLRSAAFFNVAKYHDMRFRSAPFPREMLLSGGDIEGWLTLRGQTRPVEFTLAAGTCAQPLHKPCELRLRGTIDRDEFGMRAHGLTVSHRVQLRLQIVLTRNPDNT